VELDLKVKTDIRTIKLSSARGHHFSKTLFDRHATNTPTTRHQHANN
jgi:hypothetical protein